MTQESDRLLPSSMQRLHRIEALRPMNTGEVLDLSIKVFRSLGHQVLRPTFGAAALVYIAFTMMTQLLLPQLFYTKTPGSISGQVIEVITALMLGIFAALPIVLVGMGIIVTHSVHAVSDFFSNVRPHPIERQKRADADLYRGIKVIGRMSLVAFSGLLLTILLLLVSALLSSDATRDLSALSGGISILAGVVSVASLVYVAIRYAVAPAASLIERLDPKQSCKRSFALLKSYRGAGSGDDTVVALSASLLLLALFLWGGIAFLYGTLGVIPWLTSVIGRFWWGEVGIALVSGLPYLLGFWVMVPLWSIGNTVIYYERRIRLEGYDIELLNQELSSKNRR